MSGVVPSELFFDTY